MILSFYTPKGVIQIDGDTVTDAELAKLGVPRERLPQLIADQSGLLSKMDALVKRVERLEKK